jgi:mevalonate kinase
VLDVFWCGVPAATTAMRGRVDALRRRDLATYRARLDEIAAAAASALCASRARDLHAFVRAIRESADALAALGRDADAPIFFPPRTADLVPLAHAEDGAFTPSGAGGGDVFVHVGEAEASARFVAAAHAAGMRRLTMRPDASGVRVCC